MENEKDNKRKRRFFLLAGTLAGVGSLAAVGVGVTFGLFSATSGGQTNTFSAGTVTLSQTLTHICHITKMVPGDGTATYSTGSRTNATDVACVMKVKYTGNVPADLGLNVAFSGTGLYNSSSTGLQVKVTDTKPTTFMTGTSLGGTPTVGTTPSTTNLLVGVNLATGTTYTVTVNFKLPLTATNSFQTKATTIQLKAHAVQYANNGPKATVTACADGSVCASIARWS